MRTAVIEDEDAPRLGAGENLDDVIARLAAARTKVEDPDGLVCFTLGEDGRPLSLFIHHAATTSLTNVALEQKLNRLLAAGNEAMRRSRKELGFDLHDKSVKSLEVS